jgi:hypothetical protein
VCGLTLDGDVAPHIGFTAGLRRISRRTTRRAAQPLEVIEVVLIDGPDRPDLDSVEPLPDQEPSNIGVRSVQLGGCLLDREQAWSVDGRDFITGP